MVSHSPTDEPRQSALRRLREQERRRLRGEFEARAERPGERDVGFILPHLATSPNAARNFAVLVAEQLDSGTLPYDNRVKLMAHAKKVGLRIFEANLIIAAVQHNSVPMKLVTAESESRSVTDPVERSWLSKWWKPIVLVIVLEIAAVVGWLIWR